MSKIIAHRGYSGKAPENTMAAFVMALENGADGLETDVHMTKDGILVVCHDELVDRTTNGSGLIKEYTYEELRTLDAGSWFSPAFAGETIPRLTDLFDLVKGSDILVNVEVKSGFLLYPGIEEKLVGLISKYQLDEQVIISSFNHYSLARLRKLTAKIQTAILYMEGLYEPWEYARTIGAQVLHPYYKAIVPEIVQEAQEQGFKVNPFTVNEQADIAQVLAMKVDGIITNYPGRVLHYQRG